MIPATRVTLVTVVLLAGTALAVYAPRLDEAPMYLSPDEVIIAVDAHSIASTARDVEGKFLPLYFNIQMPGETRRGWFTPAVFYFSALFYKVLPLSEKTVRLPTVIVGIIDIVLMFFLAKRVFKSQALAIFASVLLALTPAHFILSRLGLDYIYPLPFVLGWMLCLASFLEHERAVFLFAGTALLGIGFYSYIASVLLMPLYLMLTLAVLFERHKAPRCYVVAVAGFCLALLLLIPWLITHPTAFNDTMDRYAVYDSKNLDALQGLRSFLSYTRIDELASMYWNFFNPSFLFLSGDAQMMFSTRSVGVFLIPVAVFLPLGIYAAGLYRPTPLGLVALVGFITAPAAALIVAEGGAIHRAPAMLIFGVLLATFGAEYLWSATLLSRRRRVLTLPGAALLTVGVVYALWTLATQSRVTMSTLALITLGIIVLAGGLTPARFRLGPVVALCLIALMPLQFARFSSDYFHDYRLRAAPWFGGNLRGALEAIIELDRQEHRPLIYFSRLQTTSGLADIKNRWMDAYWKFYLIKHGRRDLLDRTARFDSLNLESVPPHSLVLANLGSVPTDAALKSGELKLVELIPEISGNPFFAILQR